MAKIQESTNNSPIHTALDSGFNTLDREDEIIFSKYLRQVLPLDGYVFWVKDTTVEDITVRGSLHYSTDQEQREDETIGINRVILTTSEQIADFNEIAGNEVWIGAYDSIRFAFTANGKFYRAADLYHYQGDAIYPAMYSQIIDSPSSPVNLGAVIATNSLPIWLSLNKVMTSYPAFLLPSNIRPPYAAISIVETTPIQAAPYIEKNSTHWQLVRDKVKVTIYGERNNDALDFQDYVFQQSLDTENFGIMNIPIVKDEVRTQSELGIIAIKKTIEFEINYYQNRALDVARKMITSAFCNVTLGS